MDWNLKSHEIDEDTRGNGSNSFGFLHSNFSVDLKLGHVVTPIQPKMASASSKRTRAVVSSGVQTAFCLVDGCSADLSNCREYHRRHKVCEVHSKTPEVTIGGHKRRFCQQCSRFHSLGEFDEGKRSCRKRLDGHNRRRRKPQPESSSHRRMSTFFSNYHPGERMFPFSTTDRAYTTTSAMNNHPIWSEGFRNDPFSAASLSSSIRSLREEGKQQIISNNNNNNVFSTNNPTMLFNELPPKYGYDMNGQSSQILGSSNRALSLLSSPSHQHQPEIIGLYPSTLHQHYGGLNNMSSSSSSSSSVMVQNGGVNYQTMFQGQSSAQVPHTFPFYWRDA